MKVHRKNKYENFHHQMNKTNCTFNLQDIEESISKQY